MNSRWSSKLVLASLALNALGFAAVWTLLDHSTMPSALAQDDLAPGAWRNSGDVIVTPGQMTSNTYGCYVVDVRTGTMCVYQYVPGERLLRLQASRDIRQDVGLKSFNTQPLPSEVAELIEHERGQRGLPAATTRAVQE